MRAVVAHRVKELERSLLDGHLVDNLLHSKLLQLQYDNHVLKSKADKINAKLDDLLKHKVKVIQ